MKKFAKFASVGLALTMTLGLGTAMVSAEEEAAGAPLGKTDGFVIGFSDMMLGTNTWFQEMEQDVKATFEEYKEEGIISDYYITNADGDLSKQQSDIRDLIALGVDAIFYVPINPEGLNEVLEEAHEEGILTFASGQIDTNENAVFDLVCNTYEVGYAMGEGLAMNLPDDGKIFLIKGMSGAQTAEDRVVGALQALEDLKPDVEIIGEGYGEFDYATSRTLIEDLVAANPEFDGVLCTSGHSSLAVLDYLSENGYDMETHPVAIEGENGNLRWWKTLKDEFGYDTLAPVDTPHICAVAVDGMMQYLQTGTLPEDWNDFEEGSKVIYWNMDPITSETLDDWYEPELPDTYWSGVKLTDEAKKELYGL